MAVQNRQTLRNYFSSGQRPSGKQFEDLLDSVVHIHDEVIKKSKDHVIEVAPAEKSRDVISILGKPGEAPGWAFSLQENGDLAVSEIMGGKGLASLVFKTNGDIEMHGNNIITAGHRKGVCTEYAANGEWHTVAKGLEGVNVLEIIAAYTGSKGKSSTLMAWASHCCGRRRKIRRMRPRTFFWNNKIRVRWVRVKDAHGSKTLCDLQVKTRYKAGDGTLIKCSTTTLWGQQEADR
jgi:hypothetical protein